MGRFRDLTGKTFTRLTVLERGPNKGSGTRWWCDCTCGERCLIWASALVKGLSKSCGCLHRSMVTTHGHTRKGKKSKTWNAWHDMRERCRNQTNKHWKDYGGRGITVCERWGKFSNFIADMGEAPLGLFLDRINNDGNYEPENCRWVTPKQSARNRRNGIPTRRANNNMPTHGEDGRFV